MCMAVSFCIHTHFGKCLSLCKEDVGWKTVSPQCCFLEFSGWHFHFHTYIDNISIFMKQDVSWKGHSKEICSSLSEVYYMFLMLSHTHLKILLSSGMMMLVETVSNGTSFHFHVYIWKSACLPDTRSWLKVPFYMNLFLSQVYVTLLVLSHATFKTLLSTWKMVVEVWFLYRVTSQECYICGNFLMLSHTLLEVLPASRKKIFIESVFSLQCCFIKFIVLCLSIHMYIFF